MSQPAAPCLSWSQGWKLQRPCRPCCVGEVLRGNQLKHGAALCFPCQQGEQLRIWLAQCCKCPCWAGNVLWVEVACALRAALDKLKNTLVDTATEALRKSNVDHGALKAGAAICKAAPHLRSMILGLPPGSAQHQKVQESWILGGAACSRCAPVTSAFCHIFSTSLVLEGDPSLQIIQHGPHICTLAARLTILCLQFILVQFNKFQVVELPDHA